MIKELGKVIVEKIEEDQFKVDADGNPVGYAQIRQIITKKYGTQVSTELSTSLFSAEALNLKPSEVHEEHRVHFALVPIDCTVEEAQALIDQMPNPGIWKILSHNVEDVMVEKDKQAVANSFTMSDGTVCDLDYYKEKYRVPTEDSSELPIYRSLHFSNDLVEDVDLRPDTEADAKSEVEEAAAIEGLTEVSSKTVVAA